MRPNIPSGFTSRAEAIAAGANNYFNGVPCSKGHVALRNTSEGKCTECNRLKVMAWSLANSERAKATNKAWKRSNPDKRNSYSAGWRERNRGNPKLLEYAARARKKQCKRQRCAWQRAREARKIGATPPWVDTLALKRFYQACPQGHHVDHIVPLQNKNVCGLHVLWNLQYLTPTENLRKKNKFKVKIGLAA